MFEKEAEKYRTHFENELYLFDNTDIFPNDIEKAYQKGATDGYNKANEWHYVSKKGFPKDEKAYFVIINYGALGNECGVMENLNKDKPKNVIAWKEIVLPKESE
jgi:hypothetical protein